jgi:release factor glutamine methyltransferase
VNSARVSGQQLWQWWLSAQREAKAAAVSAYELNYLFQEVAGLDTLALKLGTFQHWAEVPLTMPLEQLECLWRRRIQERVPIQYLLGTAYWRAMQLTVTPAVLIPRPETECMIDFLADSLRARSIDALTTQGHWVDLGTGSGAIALALAQLLPQATIHAVDWSEDALAIAQRNATQLNLAQRIQFHQGSWFEPLAHLRGQVNGMLANPPYIPSETVLQLQPEVANHEPHLALDGGADGLACIRQLVAIAPDYLCSGGMWLIEMMIGQAPIVMELLHQQGSYRDIHAYADLAGIERFVMAYRC